MSDHARIATPDLINPVSDGQPAEHRAPQVGDAVTVLVSAHQSEDGQERTLHGHIALIAPNDEPLPEGHERSEYADAMVEPVLGAEVGALVRFTGLTDEDGHELVEFISQAHPVQVMMVNRKLRQQPGLAEMLRQIFGGEN